ncbi:hypothetical protein CCP1ISM_130011 [Azospirillaceae bacterium]
MGISLGMPNFVNQIDVYTTVTVGTTVDISTFPLKNFTFSVTPNGSVNSWSVIVEGSLDGINFTTIGSYSNPTGTGITVFPGVNIAPCFFFRSRCTSIDLGSGTSITVTVLGVV